MSEKKLETAILDYLNMLEDTFAIKVNTTGTYDPRKKVFRKNSNPHCHNGTADILGVCKKRFFAIEVKWGLNKASADQRIFLDRIEQAGGKTLVTNSFDDCLIWFKTTFPDIKMGKIGKGLFD